MDDILAFLSFSLSVKLLCSFLNRGTRHKESEFVGVIDKIILYPLKGAKGIYLDTAECIHRGIKYVGKDVFDRNFVIINKAGECVHSSHQPRISLIRCTIKRDNMVLEAENMTPMNVPLHRTSDPTMVKELEVLFESVEGQDCGDAAGEWISKVIGKDGFRLLYGADNLKKRQMNLQVDKWKKDARDNDLITFQNGFPLMVASQTSLDDLNTKLPEPMEMTRFRPNIVVSGDKAKPFDEDNWKELWIGNLKFTQLKPCNRCPVTTVDPEKGTMNTDNEPLKTLRKFRLKKEHFAYAPMFGINLILDNQVGGMLSVGDPVYILRGNVTDP